MPGRDLTRLFTRGTGLEVAVQDAIIGAEQVVKAAFAKPLRVVLNAAGNPFAVVVQDGTLVERGRGEKVFRHG